MNPFLEYRITSPYGYRLHPVHKVWKMHTGIDLVKHHQAPIPTFTGGMVIHAADALQGTGFGGFGIVVAVKDKHDNIHCYCHLDSVAVKVGQMIEKGQEIGKQGNTGIGTGSHLHYEVRTSSGAGYGFGRNTEPTAYLLRYLIADVEGARTQLIVLCQEEWRRSAGLPLVDRVSYGKDRAHELAEILRQI